MTGEEAQARSRMVRRLRIALPVGALFLIGLFFVNAGRNAPEPVFLDEFKDVTATAEDLRMKNPTFSGIDAKGKPFDITAEAAIQSPETDKIVDLEFPRAVTRSDDETSVVTAKAGQFRSEENLLFLREDVRFEHEIAGENYVLITPAAKVAIDQETVESDTGVNGMGPDGSTLRADTMHADNGSGVIRFEGNVSMRIYPSDEAGLSLPGKVNSDGGESAAGDKRDEGETASQKDNTEDGE